MYFFSTWRKLFNISNRVYSWFTRIVFFPRITNDVTDLPLTFILDILFYITNISNADLNLSVGGLSHAIFSP